jgi:hypothetical protein
VARWLVQLDGERIDLEEYRRWFPDGDTFFAEENGAFLLTGRALDEQPDEKAVRVGAMRALEECFSLISILSPNVQKPVISQVFRVGDDGKRHVYVFAEPVTATMRFGTPTLTVSGGTQPEAPSPTEAQLLLAAMKANPHLRTAVSLWGQPGRSWPRLYTILEEIEIHLGMPANKAGHCSAKDRKRFRQSAQAREVAGADSRHAAGEVPPPKRPMSLPEATAFMRGLLDRVLRRP